MRKEREKEGNRKVGLANPTLTPCTNMDWGTLNMMAIRKDKLLRPIIM